MTKKNWLPVILLVGLAACYVIWFTDWFKPKTIHIFHTVRELRFQRAGAGGQEALIFGVQPAEIELTEIKVVPLADFEKNPQTLPVWHLVSDSNSIPVRDFTYGWKIRGMRPAVAGAEPGELDSNIVYRIFIRAGGAKGQHDFRIGGPPEQKSPDSNS